MVAPRPRLTAALLALPWPLDRTGRDGQTVTRRLEGAEAEAVAGRLR